MLEEICRECPSAFVCLARGVGPIDQPWCSFICARCRRAWLIYYRPRLHAKGPVFGGNPRDIVKCEIMHFPFSPYECDECWHSQMRGTP